MFFLLTDEKQSEVLTRISPGEVDLGNGQLHPTGSQEDTLHIRITSKFSSLDILPT